MLAILVLVVGLLSLVGFSFLGLTQPGQSRQSSTSQQTSASGGVSILTNKLLFFGSTIFQGKVYRAAAEWNVTIRNDLNESARFTISTYVNGNSGGGYSSQVGPSQTFSNISMMQVGLSENFTYKISVFAFTSNGLKVLNSTATTQVARQVSVPNGITVGNDKIDSLLYSAKYNTYYSDWTIDLTNSGTKPVAVLTASLSNSTESMGFAYSYLSGNFLDTNKSFSAFPTPTKPMAPGQSTELFAVLSSRVPSGSGFNVTVTALYADGTQSTTDTSVSA
jgi:hypothetical protein